ncbi:efflux RND transporter periplasmic adaptor subunit [Microcoleus sp. herbarium12]
MATKQKAQVDLNLSYVKAPVSGSLLKVHTRAGERINTQDRIIELGHTDQMYAVAEVYETDIAKVRNGQRASHSYQRSFCRYFTRNSSSNQQTNRQKRCPKYRSCRRHRRQSDRSLNSPRSRIQQKSCNPDKLAGRSQNRYLKNTIF